MLDAATVVFYERGFSAASIEDVAKVLGILKGSLYYYIDSKQDLLYSIIEDVHASVAEIFEATTSDTQAPALERLARFARAQVEYNARNLKPISVYYHDYERLDEPLAGEVRKKRRQHEKDVLALLKQAQSEGDIPADVDTRLAASCVFAVIIWPYTWYRPGVVSPRVLADFCTDFILGGLVCKLPGRGVEQSVL